MTQSRYRQVAPGLQDRNNRGGIVPGQRAAPSRTTGTWSPGAAPPPSSASGGKTARLSARDLELFFSQASKMVNAGLSLERALGTIEKGDPGSQRSAVAGAIVRSMRGGLSPARAFAEDRINFDDSALALIRSGELTGDLGPALAEIERLIVARNQLNGKIRTALIYPGILALVSLGSVLMILLVVIPQFEELVRAHMSRLPPAARFVFWLSDAVRALAMPLIVVASTAVVLVLRAAHSGQLERMFIGVLGTFSSGRSLIMKAQAAALFRMLGALLSRQVLLMPAIDVARQTVVDPGMAEAVDEVRDRLKSGARLATALAETGAFPPISVQLAHVGEETGDLGGMLVKAAQMLEEDLERTTKLFLIWFEPILLLGIGTLIGGLLYGLFSAILSINNIV